VLDDAIWPKLLLLIGGMLAQDLDLHKGSYTGLFDIAPISVEADVASPHFRSEMTTPSNKNTLWGPRMWGTGHYI
jgi:hypothetical protein